MCKVKPAVGATVWITRFALTDGVQKVVVTDSCTPTVAMIDYRINGRTTQRCHSNFCHLDKKAALRQAIEMVEKKREVLKTEADRLDRLEYEWQAQLAQE